MLVVSSQLQLTVDLPNGLVRLDAISIVPSLRGDLHACMYMEDTRRPACVYDPNSMHGHLGSCTTHSCLHHRRVAGASTPMICAIRQPPQPVFHTAQDAVYHA